MSFLIAPQRFAAAGPPTSAKWRFNFSNKQSGSAVSYILAEAEMRATLGGADQCSGGTASAQFAGISNPASNAFDNDVTTTWDSSNSSNACWLEYDFLSALTANQVLIHGNPASGNNDPIAFTVEYWDGSNWQVYFTVPASNHWGPDYVRVYSKDDPLVAGHSNWRINITAVQTAGNWPAVLEMELRLTAGGADQTVPITSTAGDCFESAFNAGSDATKAFDNDATTRWTAGTGSLPQQLGYRFDSQKDITEIALTSWGTPGDSLTAFDVQYYDQALNTWGTSWSVASTGTWSANQTKVFTKP